ncbi:hypothetical protein FSOLCH5_003257 [Fusarium solani]
MKRIWRKEEADAVARNLAVTIEQVSKSPLTIKVEIKNNSTMPKTFINDSTPLDPEAFGPGLFHITPDNLSIVNFGNRVLPPRSEIFHSSDWTFIELSPGMAISDTVTILAENPTRKKEWTKVLLVADKVKMQMKGNWEGVWAKTRRGTMKLIDRYGWHYLSRPATFESNIIELELQ